MTSGRPSVVKRPPGTLVASEQTCWLNAAVGEDSVCSGTREQGPLTCHRVEEVSKGTSLWEKK